MSVKIENCANHNILLRFNSGLTLHLGPGQHSNKIIETEINGNDRIQRLEKRQVIRLHSSEKGKSAAARPKKQKAALKK